MKKPPKPDTKTAAVQVPPGRRGDTVPRSITFKQDFLDEVDARARELRLTRTAYIIRCIELNLASGGDLLLRARSDKKK